MELKYGTRLTKGRAPTLGGSSTAASMAGEARTRGSSTAASMERAEPRPPPRRTPAGVHGGRAPSSCVLDSRRRRRAPSSSAPNSSRRPWRASSVLGGGLARAGEGCCQTRQRDGADGGPSLVQQPRRRPRARGEGAARPSRGTRSTRRAPGTTSSMAMGCCRRCGSAAALQDACEREERGAGRGRRE
ncbi:hypothetical protein PVAP13_9NG639650 [Panicum virgatum]|uniref:Uncharacterized protein n=1 Tax=Panicum virgatum TaxID=38727 RepID=A0A8T0N5W4_PANVG|nr:hypothetical protein PVAP13_9NG639650 [Panicum virgatum]